MKTEICKFYSRVFWIFMPDIIKINPYNFEPYRFKVGWVNYPDLVASYDTRPGNEVSLFYNASLRSPHGLVRPFVCRLLLRYTKFPTKFDSIHSEDTRVSKRLSCRWQNARCLRRGSFTFSATFTCLRPICLAEFVHENRNTFIIRSEAICGWQLSFHRS